MSATPRRPTNASNTPPPCVPILRNTLRTHQQNCHPAMRVARVEEPALSLSKGSAVVLAFAVALPTPTINRPQRRKYTAFRPKRLTHLSPTVEKSASPPRLLHSQRRPSKRCNPQHLRSSNSMDTENLTGSALPSSQTVPSDNFMGKSSCPRGLGSTLPTSKE
jgi:hypothetical protein